MTKPRSKPTKTRPQAKPKANRRRIAAERVVDERGIEALTFGYHGIRGSDIVTPETAMRVGGIFACCRFIAQAVACMPGRVIRTLPDGSKERVTDQSARTIGAYYALCERPNGWMSTFDFKQLQLFQAALYGRSYARKIPGPRGMATSLVPLHPSRMRRPQMQKDGTLIYPFLQADGSFEPIPQAEIVHTKWISDDGIEGMPPSEVCNNTIALAQALDRSTVGFWKNNARPDLLLESTEKIPDEAVEALRQQMADLYGGPDNRGRPAMLPVGVTAKPIAGNSAESAQLIDQMDSIVASCARIWGLPSTLIGDYRMAKFSNVEQEFLTAHVFCLQPWALRYEGAYDLSIMQVYREGSQVDGIAPDRVHFKLDPRGLLKADTAARTALYQSLFNMGAITPNEIRSLEDFDLLDDPAADETYMQLGFSTLGAAAASAIDPNAGAAGDGSSTAPALDPAADPAATLDAAAAGAVTLADTSLNGAQVTALIEVLTQVSTGVLSPAAAVVLITSAFPTVTADQATKMVEGVNTQPQGGTNGA